MWPPYPRAEGQITKAIVTISFGPKFQLERHHDPKKKKTGICPAFGKGCTDITGAHHSGFVEAPDEESISRKASDMAETLKAHVTRIEVVEL